MNDVNFDTAQCFALERALRAVVSAGAARLTTRHDAR
jgi:hypothetical protein